MSRSLRVRAFGEGREDVYLTALPASGRSAERGAREVYDGLCAELAARGLEPVQEKIYGLRRARASVLKARAAAFSACGLDASLPSSYIEGRPVSGSFAGVQLWALSRGRREEAVRTLRHRTGGGRLWSDGGRRFLYLPAIDGTSPDGTLPSSRGAQARRMFLNARAALKAGGFEFSDVVRTWIYLHRILEWYADFNAVRSALYRRPGFFGRSFFERAPASTGIEGRGRRGDCVMDLLAVRSEGARGTGVEWVRRSARQGPAPAYGSAFSRAAALGAGARRTVHVSGTASIDAEGRSFAVGDAEGQSVQTLRSVAAVLEACGTGFDAVATSVVFHKSRPAFAAFRRAARRLRLPSWPVVPLLADVCRPELLVEMEAVAVAPRGKRRHFANLPGDRRKP
ncbi:MAG: RidA family protein [Elusimicrobiota bacterium]